jgi:hypothetical protein
LVISVGTRAISATYWWWSLQMSNIDMLVWIYLLQTSLDCIRWSLVTLKSLIIIFIAHGHQSRPVLFAF